MSWKKELGNQLRGGRADLFLNQEELCSRVGLHVNSVSRYENGASAPELDVLIRLAVALGIEEFVVEEHIVTIKALTPSAEKPRDHRQLRLEYGKQYVFDDGEAQMRVQPGKSGLFIVAQNRSA
jgi:transcriptional regulator with XRE-family HTH domain